MSSITHKGMTVSGVQCEMEASLIRQLIDWWVFYTKNPQRFITYLFVLGFTVETPWQEALVANLDQGEAERLWEEIMGRWNFY